MQGFKSPSLGAIDNHLGMINVLSFGAKGDGVTDDSVAIQSAIDYATITGGIVQFGNKTYRAQGLTPKNNVTLRGTGILKLVDNPSQHLIYYNSNTVLNNFNLFDLTLDGNSQTNYDIIHIEKTTPSVITYVWDKSVIDNCQINNGGVGVYCSIPGAVKIVNSFISYNDIGLYQIAEHFYLTNVTVWGNRVGASINKMNHATWVNAIFAHNAECGILGKIVSDGTGSAFQNAFIGCSFIDNVDCFKGFSIDSRFIGCRMIDSTTGISYLYAGNVVSGCEFSNLTSAIIMCDSPVAQNNSITDCNFHVNTNDIIITGDNHIITNNQFRLTEAESIKTLTTSMMALNIQNNLFFDTSTLGLSLYPCIAINATITATTISNNIFRNSAAGLASHGISMPATISATDVVVLGNVSRNMKTSGYQLKSTITQANNIGSVVAV